MSAPYPSPLDRLLTLGDAWKMRDWPDYLALGLGPEHIPDLIRLATDPELNDADSDSAEVWAPGHAWRALAQLHAVEAAAPLTGLFRRIDEAQDDFVGEDLPVAFGVLGPAAIGPLVAYLADETNGPWARIGAANGLVQIATHHPDARAACVAAVVNQLDRFSDQDPVLNGSLVADLVELKAVDAAPMIGRAFAADRGDEMAVGDWEDVQLALIPHADKSVVAALVRTVFAQPNLTAARQQLAEIAGGMQSRWPAAADRLRGAEDDVLAYMTFPEAHSTRIYSTNVLERLNREIKRRTDVRQVFPTDGSVVRLAGAVGPACAPVS